MIEQIKSVMFGLSVGDALGVPVEFKSRDFLKHSPVSKMMGHGTWNQPPGTWSDDSSLAFCLAESFIHGYDLNKIADNFIAWLRRGFWGAHHKVFDVGNTTQEAIDLLAEGITPVLAGGMMETNNGNGSLMRIIPLIFMIKDLDIEGRYSKVREVSSLTHAHFRSVFACFIYVEMCLLILKGRSADKAYSEMKIMVEQFVKENEFNKAELVLFNKILQGDIQELDESSIRSDGYVIHTLEASLWCILKTRNYREAVLKAVNLGGDTDTTACVTGGMAGLIYGYDDIPKEWISTLARTRDIENLCERLSVKLKK